MIQELLQKYIWLVQTFIRAGERGLSLEELLDRWEYRWDSPYNRRSFNNHRQVIEELFGIHIECDRRSNRYFIAAGGDLSDGSGATAWLIDTFTVNNLLSRSKDRLSGRVSVEEVPSGHRHLTDIMEAMEDNRILTISYGKYGSDSSSVFTVRPYAVKEAARRWYLVGWCEEREGLRVYGLDRVMDLKITDRSFVLPKDFDVDSLFATSYGVYLMENAKAVEVVFKAEPIEARFLADLPLHPSQKALRKDADGTTFSIRVSPNRHLIMDLMARSDRLEVLSPKEVRDSIRNEVDKMKKIYGD